MAKLLLLVVGVIFILLGMKTIKKKEATVILRLWSWGDDNVRSPGGGFTESVQTGFVAVVIGVLQVLLGIAAIVQVFTKQLP